MNALLEHFRSESRIIPSHISPLSFLVTVASVLGDSDLAHTVVSLLTTHQGGISSREAPPELRAAAHKLTEAGVLAFNRARRGYQVTVPYREALSVMRGNDTLYLLTTARQRSRRRNA